MMMRQLLKCSIIVAVVGMFFLPAFAQEPFNPYEKLKEGDWVKYKSEYASGTTSEMEQRVTKIEGKKLTYEIHSRMFMDGKPLGEPSKSTDTVDLSTTQEPPKDGSVEYATLKVNGKELKCEVSQYETEEDGKKTVIKKWLCKDVPSGCVKTESNGKVIWELVDWEHWEDTTLKVNGKELKCKVSQFEAVCDGRKFVTKIWMCEDVPFGTVKIANDGEVIMELVDWGSKE